MSNHTPDPWSHSDTRGLGNNAYHVYGPEGFSICSVKANAYPIISNAPAFDYANAKLIAKAPEMYELLKELIQFHPLYDGEVKSHSHIELFVQATKLLKQLGA